MKTIAFIFALLSRVISPAIKTYLAILLFAFSPCVAGAEPSSPPKDSPERKAILDALRPPLNKLEGAKVKFVDPKISMLKGWVTVSSGFVREDGSPVSGDDFDLDYFAVVQRVGTKWHIRSWGFSGDPSAVMEGRRANPEAPAEIFPDYADSELAKENESNEAREPERNKAGIFSAKPGTPERKEILDAIRPRIEKELGEPVIFRVDFIHVGKEWALLQGRARKADDSQFPFGTEIDYVTVLLKKAGSGWQIVHRDKLRGPSGYFGFDDLQKKFQKAPALLFP